MDYTCDHCDTLSGAVMTVGILLTGRVSCDDEQTTILRLTCGKYLIMFEWLQKNRSLNVQNTDEMQLSRNIELPINIDGNSDLESYSNVFFHPGKA